MCSTLLELDQARGPALLLRLSGGALAAAAPALVARSPPHLLHAWVHPAFRVAPESILPRPRWTLDPLGETEQMLVPAPHLSVLDPAAPVATAALARITLGRSGVWVHLALVARRRAPREPLTGSSDFAPAAPGHSAPFGAQVWDAEHRCWEVVVRWTWRTSSVAAASRTVSKQHATVFASAAPARMLVRDLGSASGTHASVVSGSSSRCIPVFPDQPALWLDPANTRIHLGRPGCARSTGTTHSGAAAQVRSLHTLPRHYSPVNKEGGHLTSLQVCWIPDRAREPVRENLCTSARTSSEKSDHARHVQQPVIDLTNSSPSPPTPFSSPRLPQPEALLEDEQDCTLVDPRTDDRPSTLGKRKRDTNEDERECEAEEETPSGVRGREKRHDYDDRAERGPRKKWPRLRFAARMHDWLTGGVVGAVATFTTLAALGAHWHDA